MLVLYLTAKIINRFVYFQKSMTHTQANEEFASTHMTLRSRRVGLTTCTWKALKILSYVIVIATFLFFKIKSLKDVHLATVRPSLGGIRPKRELYQRRR